MEVETVYFLVEDDAQKTSQKGWCMELTVPPSLD